MGADEPRFFRNENNIRSSNTYDKLIMIGENKIDCAYRVTDLKEQSSFFVNQLFCISGWKEIFSKKKKGRRNMGIVLIVIMKS